MRSISWMREAAWLDTERVHNYSRIFAVLYLAVALGWVSGILKPATSPPIGGDFLTVWASSDLALKGQAPSIYDFRAHYGAERRAMGIAGDDPKDFPYYFSWHYPPVFLVLTFYLSIFPYYVALGVWMSATLAGYLAAARAVLLGPGFAWFALSFPAVLTNALHGQNGFLTAALMTGGLALAFNGRELAAGALIGALSYKPQFGVLVPFALAAAGMWRTFAWATVAVIMLAAISAVLFGVGVWVAFIDSLPATRDLMLAHGGPLWPTYQTMFGAVRLIGGSYPTAAMAQAAVSAVALAGVVSIWRGPAPAPVKGAALSAGALLATPFALDYDLVLLAPAIGWLAREGWVRGFLPYEKIVLLLAWVLPLVSRAIAELVGIPLAPAVILGVFWLAFRRARLTAAR